MKTKDGKTEEVPLTWAPVKELGGHVCFITVTRQWMKSLLYFLDFQARTDYDNLGEDDPQIYAEIVQLDFQGLFVHLDERYGKTIFPMTVYIPWASVISIFAPDRGVEPEFAQQRLGFRR